MTSLITRLPIHCCHLCWSFGSTGAWHSQVAQDSLVEKAERRWALFLGGLVESGRQSESNCWETCKTVPPIQCLAMVDQYRSNPTILGELQICSPTRPDPFHLCSKLWNLWNLQIQLIIRGNLQQDHDRHKRSALAGPTWRRLHRPRRRDGQLQFILLASSRKHN